jgi:hypothetical protein
MVKDDPADVVFACVLAVLPLLLVPPPPLVLVLVLHAVSTAAADSSAAHLVIVSDLFRLYFMGLLLERLVAMRSANRGYVR